MCQKPARQTHPDSWSATGQEGPSSGPLGGVTGCTRCRLDSVWEQWTHWVTKATLPRRSVTALLHSGGVWKVNVAAVPEYANPSASASSVRREAWDVAGTRKSLDCFPNEAEPFLRRWDSRYTRDRSPEWSSRERGSRFYQDINIISELLRHFLLVVRN